MRVWMQDTQGRKNRTAVHICAGVAGITVLAVGMTAAAAVLTIYTEEEYKEIASLAMCLLTVGIAITLAMRLRRRMMGAFIAFFQDDSSRIYMVDIGQLAGYRRGLTGTIAMSYKVQKLIPEVRKQAESEKAIPISAIEILDVEKITEHSGSYSLLCQVRYPNGNTGNTSINFAKGYEDEDTLLCMLERKLRWRASFEAKKRFSPAGILISLIAVLILSGVCILSHPYMNILPHAVYFPCLGADAAAIFIMVYFIVCYRMGK